MVLLYLSIFQNLNILKVTWVLSIRQENCCYKMVVKNIKIKPDCLILTMVLTRKQEFFEELWTSENEICRVFNSNMFKKSRCITELFHAISNHHIHIFVRTTLKAVLWPNSQWSLPCRSNIYCWKSRKYLGYLQNQLMKIKVLVWF